MTTNKPETLDEMYELYIANKAMRRDMFRAVIDKINELENRLNSDFKLDAPPLATFSDGPNVALNLAKRKPGRPRKQPPSLNPSTI